MRILDHLIAPERMDEASIEAAFIASRDQILLGNMSRFDFADVAYQTSNLRTLPIGHLLDHRLRGPLIPPIAPDVGPFAGQDWLGARSTVTEWLKHMLEPSDRAGARDIVARSLGLEPEQDAALLTSLGERSREFFRHCVRGRLSRAIWQVERDLPGTEREQALALVAKLMVYFSCMSIHLVAARAWWVDHFLSDDGDTADPTAFLSSMKDLSDTADAAINITDYMAGRNKRYPRRKVVSESMVAARQWRLGFPETDEVLRGKVIVQLARLAQDAKPIADALYDARARAGTANPSVHRALFGITAGEALAYGATRLIQLRDNSTQMVGAVRLHNEVPRLTRGRKSLPPINSKDVAALLYVLRITTLRDGFVA